MILAGEVVEKSAFTDVGGFGDVLNGSLRKPFLAEEDKRRTKQAFANFSAPALTAVASCCRKLSLGVKLKFED